ncbi:MAG: nucleotide-binding protein [Tepidisphaera sp.]
MMTSRDQLELALRRLGLEPFILMNSSGDGKTIIESLEGHIGRDYSSDFGIVLMTPDDMGYAKREGDTKSEPRARQNVILETGMLLASLTRNRMALLVKGHLEIPSDLQGIIRLPFNDSIKDVIPKLCLRLREAGIELDQAKISDACS